MEAAVVLAVALTCLTAFGSVSGGRDILVSRCGACKAIVDELDYEVKKVDPKKTIETGNFRVDSRGKQTTKAKRYAGSEAHMVELLETVCDSMRNYGTTTDPETGRKGYTRFNTRPGETLTLSNVNLSSGGAEELTSACHYVLGEFEDDIIQLFGEGFSGDEIVDTLCYDITGYCEEYEHTEL